ncbi:hypothetical protein [Paenibacillus tyrfis]|uniref:hypothetical protein n=1 Tax=Paenibacillus tyrfis TaxID=1501230 RepID=UPI0020A10E26|nr:hypothetical protein [Paenibacillus tyrfis]MCP1307319.1 hypothetical protein [Paenibacillus tyrfis]
MENLKFHCEIVTKEVQLVGQSITANFPQHFPDAALQIQTQFVERRHEITNAKNQEVLFSPCPMEIYYFEENVEEEQVELWIPIKEK